MSAKIVVPSTVTPRMTQGENKFKGIYPYDSDNYYPQRIINAVASSGAASQCTKLYAQFLRGQGFAQAGVEKMVVNDKGETLGHVHKLICRDRAVFEGFAFWVGYNALLEITSIKHVPFQTLRIGLADDKRPNYIKYNPDWKGENKAYSSTNDVDFDLYSTDRNEILRQIQVAGGFDKWKGQIFYYSEEGHLKYPKAVADPVLEDVLTDRGIKVYKYRGTENGFLPDGMMITIGDFESKEEQEEFETGLKQYQGSDRSHKIIHVNAESKETAPQWIPFADDQKDKKYEYTETSVRNNIIGNYGQPLALHSVQQAGQLGLSKEFEEAKTLYDEKTKEVREQIGHILGSVMLLWHEGNPSTEDTFEVVPLTGIAPKAVVKPLAERIGVGGMQSLQAILLSAMEPNVKVNTMIVCFGLTQVEADAIVNGTQLPNTDVAQ